MSSRPRVALIVESSTVFGRQVLHGIGRYLRLHQPWSIFLEQREFGALPPSWLLRRKWDGVICRPTDRRLADAFLKTETPVIDLNSLRSDLPFTRIRSHNREIGLMGAEHLLERGFQRFAFCGYSVVEWSTLRRDGYFEALARSGKSCELYESAWRGGHMPEWEKDQDRMAQWVSSLPKPCGIMACNDSRAQQLLDACLRVDVSVPEGVAVLGVDNDELLCEFCDPPLSSVMPNPQRIGFEAASLLDHLMKGIKPDKPELLIEPLGVATRQSTDVLAVEDPHIASAMSYIRDHALNGCTVQDLLECVPLSRSSLERRFRKYLGRSPQSEIHACRLKRVKQLLSETDLTLSRIAELVGYEHPEYMSVVFRRETGQTPGEYRRRAQIEQPQTHRRMVIHEDNGEAHRPEPAGALKQTVR